MYSIYIFSPFSQIRDAEGVYDFQNFEQEHLTLP